MDDDCREQQLQELEALESMYASELTILCRQYPDISLRVEVRPESTEFEKLFGSSVANLQVSLPADYPNAGPSIDLSQLTAPQDGEEDGAEEELENRDEALLAVLVAKVHKELAAVVDESLGMPMLFTLINAFQETLANVCARHTEAEEEVARQRAEHAEREEQKRFEGARVTKESFEKWNKAFLEELRLKRAREGKEIQSNRLTGKQLFLADKSLNLSDLQFLNSSDREEAAEEETTANRVEIDQSLFEDDLDVSDESSDDEEYKPSADTSTDE